VDNSTASTKTSSSKIYWIAGVVVIAVGLIWYVMSPKASTMDADGDESTPVAQTTDNSSAPSSATYKDGTYTAQGDYSTHVGPEEITITLTLKDNVITDTQFSSVPNAPMSARYQGMFVDNYKQFVIGKNVNTVHLGKVSGSSLTPIGFNDALEKIKLQAINS